MNAVAIYNMKGGVGKSTTAINLSHMAATSGRRVLLWDLDPQAASSFAFRVRPRVAGFGRESLKTGEALHAAIKETDYSNLDLLPADFAYRKLDRFLDDAGKPARVVEALLGSLGRDYDLVMLDCPAGFSLLTEGLFAAVDAVLVPTIPSVLSLRMVARLVKWADRSDSPADLSAFFNMVDRRKALHRRASEWPATHPQIFLASQVPYASVVEQMAVRRMPLPVFAARDAATSAFEGIWNELQARLAKRVDATSEQLSWASRLEAIESLIVQAESAEGPEADRLTLPSRQGVSDVAAGVIHRFDTERRDLERCGHVLELREAPGSLEIVLSRTGHEDTAGSSRRVQARIDSSWAVEILSGSLSPLAALERRLGEPGPSLVESLRGLVGARKLVRASSQSFGFPVPTGR
jgi:cellulose biosynthesis protein BcsQ